MGLCEQVHRLPRILPGEFLVGRDPGIIGLVLDGAEIKPRCVRVGVADIVLEDLSGPVPSPPVAELRPERIFVIILHAVSQETVHLASDAAVELRIAPCLEPGARREDIVQQVAGTVVLPVGICDDRFPIGFHIGGELLLEGIPQFPVAGQFGLHLPGHCVIEIPVKPLCRRLFPDLFQGRRHLQRFVSLLGIIIFLPERAQDVPLPVRLLGLVSPHISIGCDESRAEQCRCNGRYKDMRFHTSVYIQKPCKDFRICRASLTR